MITFNDEKLLLNEISLGNQLAFRTLFERHRKRVYSYALKIVKSNELAEEILLDVFLKIWQHSDLNDIRNLEHYLITVTKNLSISTLRKTRMEFAFNSLQTENWGEGTNQTEETIIFNETSRVLNDAIELLPPQQKLVYTLCRLEGLKYNQVAERMSISPLTVKTHMQYALRFLRKHVEGHSNLQIVILLFQLLHEKK